MNDDSFKLYGQTVQSVNTLRDLGVQFCSSLTFMSHINKIVAKTHTRASLFHKCFLAKDAATLTKAYVTYMHPASWLVSMHLLHGRHIISVRSQN